MPEWLQQFVPDGWSSRDVLLATVGFTALTAIVSLAIVAWVVVRLPADYFVSEQSASRWRDHHPMIRWPLLILQHVFGILLVVIGIVMSLPGVPGQGFLTILIGIMLLRFPGKQRLERWVMRRPSVRMGIAKLRARFGRPPLQLDDPAPVS